VKDSRTGTILNTNMGEFEAAKAARRRKIEVEGMKEHISRLEKLLEKVLKNDVV
jgi:soluble cytochrome b562